MTELSTNKVTALAEVTVVTIMEFDVLVCPDNYVLIDGLLLEYWTQNVHCHEFERSSGWK